MSNQGGTTQVAYQSDTTNGEFPPGWHSENCRVDLDGAPLETDGAALPRRHRLPPGPSRSLGGYLDYAGWPDRERFMELDSVLQRRAQVCRDSDDHVDSDEVDCAGTEWGELTRGIGPGDFANPVLINQGQH
jgi:hypothetical protein